MTPEQNLDQLIDAIQTAVNASHQLANQTGDTDFRLLASMLTMLIVAKSKDDLWDIAEAVLPILSQSMNKSNDTEATNAVNDLLRGLNLN